MSQHPDHYDDAYMERHEGRIQNLPMLRQISGVSAIIAVALTAAVFVIDPQGGRVAFVVTSMMLVLWLVAILTFAVQHAQFATEIAIQGEYEQWRAHETTKSKRKITAHLTDDGELLDDDATIELSEQHPISGHLERHRL